MKYSRHLLIGALALILGGCGTTVQESLKVQPLSKSKIGSNKTVVILPFADYSQADNLESAYRRNLFVTENITDQFTQYGFRLPVQEDVFQYLGEQKIINIIGSDKKKTDSLEYEMGSDWSSEMKGTLQRYIDLTQRRGNYGNKAETTATQGVNQQQLVKIGRHFSADYIVRGRIIQYKDRLDPTWNPLKKGLIPFFAGTSNKILFGQAESDKYDEWNSMTSGGATGALIAGITNGDSTPTIAWGTVGVGLGYLAKHSGKVPQAVVQLRMSVQDAYTGTVIWTNRIDVKVSPKTVLADYQYDALFEQATEKAVETLMDDFAQTVYHVPPPQAVTQAGVKQP